MLTCTSLRDYAFFTHAVSEEALSESVVDLVSSAMQKVFSFEVDLGSAASAREVFGIVDGSRSACIIREIVLKSVLERFVIFEP
jgi:hypothetical protein